MRQNLEKQINRLRNKINKLRIEIEALSKKIIVIQELKNSNKIKHFIKPTERAEYK